MHNSNPLMKWPKLCHEIALKGPFRSHQRSELGRFKILAKSQVKCTATRPPNAAHGIFKIKCSVNSIPNGTHMG